MNERIIQLAEKAGVPVYKTATDGNGYEFRYTDEKLLAFAKSIIEECIQCAGPEDTYRDLWFNAKADSALRIKKRFEVSEAPKAPKKSIGCKAKRENNGVCPHHNLHCAWPQCEELKA